MANLKNYFKDPNAMDIPWCESPFFSKLLPQQIESFLEKDSTFSYKELETFATSFYNQGFVELDLGLTDEFISKLISQIDEKLLEGAVKTQAGHFHYNNGPRVFEAWKWNREVLELARNKKAMTLIEFFYGRRAIPFQTINFKLGSNQPVHSDACHFASMPHRWVCGFWTALEQMTDSNGPLVVYPGSHKEPITEFQQLNMSKTEYQGEKENYTEYENFVRQLIEARGYKPYYFLGGPGTALIWASNLLHGGSQPKGEITRWSQATHVTFLEENIIHYTPFYSDAFRGEYVLKDIANKNIRDYEIH